MCLQRCLVQISLLVAASARTEILRALEKDFVVSKNANVSEERAFFPEHNGGNPIFLPGLIPLLGQFLALIGLWDTHNLLSENAKITASNLLH